MSTPALLAPPHPVRFRGSRLARALLEGKVRDGQHVYVSAHKGELVFEQREPAAAQ